MQPFFLNSTTTIYEFRSLEMAFYLLDYGKMHQVRFFVRFLKLAQQFLPKAIAMVLLRHCREDSKFLETVTVATVDLETVDIRRQ